MIRLLFCLTIALFLCSGGYAQGELEPFKTLRGHSLRLPHDKSSKATVFIFLMPECPLCENYTLALKQLYTDFSDKGVRFYGVFSGNAYSVDEIKAYFDRYEMPFEAILDTDQRLTKLLGATVTPQVFLFAKEKLRYKGKIDNWIETGRVKRPAATKFYLRDALTAVLKNKLPVIFYTEAIGCYIETE